MSKISVSIVIPAYNEEKVILETLLKISNFFNKIEHEIIVVDDGSKDRTYEIISNANIPAIKILRNYKNYGKGYSVKRGILDSSGEFVLFTDADLSTPIEEYLKLEETIRNGYDIAIASRHVKGALIEERQPLLRELIGKCFGIFALPLISFSIKDTQCGFKLFKGEVARKIFKVMEINGYSFDLEMILLAKKMKFKIIEVPVRWKHNRTSKIKILSLLYFKVAYELLRIFIKRIKGFY